MAETSTIEWTDATWNPITGCSVVSPGCTNCYAMRLAGTRLRNHPSRAGLTQPSRSGPVWNGKVRFNEDWLTQPLHWKRPRRIFVCAHGDLFAEEVPDLWIDLVFAVMALAPQHQFQVLTKRAARMRDYFTQDDGFGRWGFIEHRARQIVKVPPGRTLAEWGGRNLPNVWLGVSVEDQERANERIPDLLATPAAIRFVSAEPLLGPINFLVTDRRGHDISALRGMGCDPTDPEGPDEYYRTGALDWVIAGGESGKGARAMHPDLARGLRDQCAAAKVPFFFKQWGMWLPEDQACPSMFDGSPVDSIDQWDWADADERGALHHWDDQSASIHLRKKQAGRFLDGREWNGMPT